MNYNDFMKSKHIAERWGEAQGTFESIDNTSEMIYYHELLTEFYDYIQYLEGHFFADGSSALTNLSKNTDKNPSVLTDTSNHFSEISSTDNNVKTEYFATSNLPEQLFTAVSPIIEAPDTSPFAANQEMLADEEDPWFGFSQ
ncbi:hypothetical protein [Lactococcus allomyrinae]|uniref:Uncharacterized protein n=1 Tax=Lactococcus allomyrinae TaxID=2419773 RepID=A0A387BGW2_9LACT|nr:hypothetical protein [Lactococcus allomyrinae]AYG01504.1 hypothetical protein D7I46_10785 [Lactococcus allomyrinae]